MKSSNPLILVFDTETTGKVNFRLPAGHPDQSRLVQLAGVLLDADTLVERGAFSFIVRPEGWSIPNEAAAIHGITTEIATRCGLELCDVLATFAAYALMAHRRVAHNLDFDETVMTAAMGHLGEGDPSNWMDGDQSRFCTMLAMTDVCRIPGNFGGYKWPKLSEAFRHCYGRDMEGAHDALSDVRACADVYRWLHRPSGPKAQPQPHPPTATKP